MSTTRWDAACGAIERHLRVANDIGTLVESNDQGRMDETTLTPSFKRQDERDLKFLKKIKECSANL